MLSQAATAQEFVEVSYDKAARLMPAKTKAVMLKSHGDYRSVFLLPSTYSTMIRAIVNGENTRSNPNGTL